MSLVRRQASDTRRENIQPLQVLLELGFLPPELEAAAKKPSKRRRNSEKEPASWSDWGSLLNRKVVVKQSRVPNSGRGLFAGVSFRRGQVVTIYGGRLMTAREAENVNSDYLLRISGEGGKKECFYVVDGAHFASGLTHREGDLYMPAPSDPEQQRLRAQGAGAMANAAPRSAESCNAQLEFRHLGRSALDRMLPALPMLIARREIEIDEEILFDYGSERMRVGGGSRVGAWLESAPAVLRLGELVAKEDAAAVRALFEGVLAGSARGTLQVAFLHGATPLQHAEDFPLLGRLLREASIWSVNLGEIRFSDEQCESLAESLRHSQVTHMFYECAYAGEWKTEFKQILTENRRKHDRWKLSDDATQNAVIFAAVKNWFNPVRHSVNKAWIERHSAMLSDIHTKELASVEAEAGAEGSLPAAAVVEATVESATPAVSSGQPADAGCSLLDADPAGAPLEAAAIDTDEELSIRLASIMLLAKGAFAWAARAQGRVRGAESASL